MNFRAKWITPEYTETLPILRKKFYQEKEIAAAKVFVSGLGFFELWINGKRAHESYFEPNESVYGKTVFYCRYDVAEYLHTGENEILVWLGNGFFIICHLDRDD